MLLLILKGVEIREFFAPDHRFHRVFMEGNLHLPVAAGIL
jgi:hypothetical protein